MKGKKFSEAVEKNGDGPRYEENPTDKRTNA